MPSLQQLLPCLLIPVCLAQDPTISQTPPAIIDKAGNEAVIDCEQKTTDHDYMYWYYKRVNEEPKLMASKVLDSEPTYEDGYKEFYEMGRTRGKKHSYLKVKPLMTKVQGVYFCASSQGDSNYQAYFGEGTVLSVLEKDETIKGPKVSIYRPSKQELEDHSFISLVCVASNFFPEHVKIRWFVNNEERINLYEPVAQKKSDNTYSTSKRLTLTRSEYFSPDSEFRCEAAFLDGTEQASAKIKGETDCGVSKETYTSSINVGKVSYIMVLCKSGLYALVVLVLVWRKKVIASSY